MPGDTVDCCPECGGTRFNRRTRLEWVETNDKYHCEECNHTFDEIATRPSKGHSTAGAGSPLGAKLARMDPDDLATDGGKHVCDACGDEFKTLTRLRLHEKDDCSNRQTFANLNPDDEHVAAEAAGGLLTCRDCGQSNPDANYRDTTSFTDGDYHLIVEFACRHCGFENENRVVMEGVDHADLDRLPPHLQPDDLSTGGDA